MQWEATKVDEIEQLIAEWLTLPDVAERLHVDVTKVRQLLRERKLLGVRRLWRSDARQAIAAARLYLCVDARERQGDLEQFLDAVLANGVDIVQLRQKGIEARHELAALEVMADACARHGALHAVNDRA